MFRLVPSGVVRGRDVVVVDCRRRAWACVTHCNLPPKQVITCEEKLKKVNLELYQVEREKTVRGCEFVTATIDQPTLVVACEYIRLAMDR